MEVQSQLQPLENLGQRFEQFGSIQTGVRNQILAHSPDEIGQWKKEEREKFAASVLSTIPPLASKRYLPYVEKPLNNYLEREAAITSWLTEKGGLDRPEVRASLVHAFSPAEEIHEDNLASDTMQFRRIHDGFALIVSPDTFQSLVVKRLRKGRDTITDPQDIARELSMYAEVGFLLNSAGIPKELGFPEGTKLVIACDEKALAHERSEVLAANIISAMDDVPRARRLEGIAIRSVSDKSFDIFPVRKALSDLAARVEEGGIPDTLSSLGVTQEYADSHPQEAKLVKAIFTAIRTRPNVFENRQELANLIRGGLLVPENLAAHLLGARDVAKILSETSLDETDFELSLESIKEGSFVYFRPTLRAGETLDHQNITYTVKRIVSQGGQGGLYEVTAGGKSFAVKEMLFPLPSAASHQKLVPFFIDGLWESQLPLNFTGNPIDHIDLPTYLNDLKQFASQLDYTGATRGQSLVERIDQHVLPQLAHIQANGTLVYKVGELQLTKFDPQNGQPIQLTPAQKQLIFTEVTQAAKEELAAIVGSPSGKALANQLNQAQERFIGESEILFSLSGIPGIAASRGIKFADVDDPDNPKWHAVYMIQEWAEGKNLASVFDLEGQPKIWEYQHSVDFMRELLTIITEVHRRGIFHKDLKPENIMENLQGHPLLVDFGIAKGSIASTSQAFRSGTQSYGTDGFAPPEVFAGSDARSDIYSLGMVLFTMLTGKDPRLIPNGSPDEIPLDPGKAPERRAMVEKILRNEQDPSGNQKIPDKLIQVILKAIDPDQAKRFQTAAAMDEELRDIRIVSVDQHLDTLFAAMNKKYFSHFYSRYPDGVKPDEEKGPRFNTIMYAIDFYDDEGKFHSQKFEDKYRLDHANPWPKEIKEYVDLLKQLSADSIKHAEIIKRITQWQQSQTGHFNRHFWSTLSKRLIDELRPNQRTVVSP